MAESFDLERTLFDIQKSILIRKLKGFKGFDRPTLKVLADLFQKPETGPQLIQMFQQGQLNARAIADQVMEGLDSLRTRRQPKLPTIKVGPAEARAASPQAQAPAPQAAPGLDFGASLQRRNDMLDGLSTGNFDAAASAQQRGF